MSESKLVLHVYNYSYIHVFMNYVYKRVIGSIEIQEQGIEGEGERNRERERCVCVCVLC